MYGPAGTGTIEPGPGSFSPLPDATFAVPALSDPACDERSVPEGPSRPVPVTGFDRPLRLQYRERLTLVIVGGDYQPHGDGDWVHFFCPATAYFVGATNTTYLKGFTGQRGTTTIAFNGFHSDPVTGLTVVIR